jgi:hypothetical protein
MRALGRVWLEARVSPRVEERGRMVKQVAKSCLPTPIVGQKKCKRELLLGLVLFSCALSEMGCMVPQPFATRGNRSYSEFWAIIGDPRYPGYLTLKSLPYPEFSYNNSYQESLKMTPFEMLYGRGVEPHCFRMILENGRFLDLTYYRMPRDKFRWRERTLGLCGRGRSVMPTMGEDNWVSWLEITCTSRCHLWQDYDISRNEASSHLGSLVCSISWRREARCYGVITQKHKLLGRENKNWGQNFHISFSIHPNLEGEIHSKEGRFVTSCFLRNKNLGIQIYVAFMSLHNSFVLMWCFSFIFVNRIIRNLNVCLVFKSVWKITKEKMNLCWKMALGQH